MTPKQKAIELQDRFRIKAGSHAGDEGEVVNDYLVAKHVAKKAAIICVDEIIESLQKYGTLIDGEDPRWIEPDTEYWQQVKTAIESL